MVFGFGTSSSSSSSSTTPSADPSNPVNSNPAPSREQRALCWKARDAYFACLEKNGVVIAGFTPKEGDGKGEMDGGFCKDVRGVYEKDCGKSWIDYFNQRRTIEARQRKTLEAAAAQGVDVPQFKR